MSERIAYISIEFVSEVLATDFLGDSLVKERATMKSKDEHKSK
jgi:hypothetical protein